MAYVDGFVVPVSKKSVDAYRRMARKAGKTSAGRWSFANASSTTSRKARSHRFRKP